MAGGADDEGLPAPFGHELVPDGLRVPGLVEVGELADVVDIHCAGLLAQLAPSRQESSWVAKSSQLRSSWAKATPYRGTMQRPRGQRQRR